MKAHGCPGQLAGALLLCASHAGGVQLTRPLLISCCQSLSTPGGNSRSPAPTRRQASGHISSKAWSRRNSSLCETSPASVLGHWSAAIRSSSISGGMSLSVAILYSPITFLAAIKLGALDSYRSVGRHKKTHSLQSLCKLAVLHYRLLRVQRENSQPIRVKRST